MTAGKNGWLMAVSIGPMQEFIQSARRTRDLWFGSYVLSTISKAVAKELLGPDTELIFPYATSRKELDDPGFVVSNVLLAKLGAGVHPDQLSPILEEAAQTAWEDFARRAVADSHVESGWLVQKRWESQIRGVVEVYTAWLPLDDSEYRNTRAELMRLLSGRKACRDFQAWEGEFGVPKSSLDGARETVLSKLDKAGTKKRAERLKLNEGEQLDTIGLTKRLGGTSGTRQQYPSVSRVAADPWLHGLDKTDCDALLRICETLRGRGLVGLSPEKFPQYRNFPWERSAVYLNHCKEAVEDAEEGLRAELLKPLRTELTRLYQKYRKPDPYLAILMADGDHMGRAISQIERAEDHQQLSRALAGFAGEAGKHVRECGGALVYAGGDDVLAFLPVDRAVECARKLRDEFAGAMANWSGPTLSVGIAIGHMMEPLEDLLEYARNAEKLAKKQENRPERDALAVTVHARSGSPVQWRAQWDSNPDAMLGKLVNDLLEDRIPDKAAHDLAERARFYRDLEDQAGNAPDWVEGAVRADALRVLGRKVSKDDSALRELEEMVRRTVNKPSDLESLTSALLIARRVQMSAQQHPGKR